MIRDKQYLLKLLNDKTVIDSITNCWLWTGPKSSFGHGRLCIDYMDIRVHRLSMYIHYDFDLESKLQINHKITCHHYNCWNPEHLYKGDQSDNMFDRFQKGEIHWHTGKYNTHCKQGHELSGDNLYTWGKQRGCRLCRKQTSQARRDRVGVIGG